MSTLPDFAELGGVFLLAAVAPAAIGDPAVLTGLTVEKAIIGITGATAIGALVSGAGRAFGALLSVQNEMMRDGFVSALSLLGRKPKPDDAERRFPVTFQAVLATMNPLDSTVVQRYHARDLTRRYIFLARAESSVRDWVQGRRATASHDFGLGLALLLGAISSQAIAKNIDDGAFLVPVFAGAIAIWMAFVARIDATNVERVWFALTPDESPGQGARNEDVDPAGSGSHA